MRAAFSMRGPFAAVAASALAGAALLLLSACLGGTGTDTENGVQVTARVTGPGGAPLAHVEISVRSIYARPDSAGEDPLWTGTGTLTTDSAGFVSFAVKKRGRYMAEGRSGDAVVLLDTLVAAPNDTVVFTTGEPVRLKGKVRLLSGFRADTGVVFVRGSGIAALVSRDGSYDLGLVPASAARMTFGTRYGAHPAFRVYVRVADAPGALIIDSKTNVVLPIDQDLVVPAGSLTIFKAAHSDDGLCLEDDTQAVIPGRSLEGMLSNTLDVLHAAGLACSGQVGALIEVQTANLTGVAIGNLGDYVLPDTLAWPIQKGFVTGFPLSQRTLPAGCIRDGADATTFLTTLQSADGEIRVDDVRREPGCLYY